MEHMGLETEKRPWPELTLLAFGLLFILVMMVRSSTGSCHHWKAEMAQVGGAFLAAAGEREYPQADAHSVRDERRTSMRDAARRTLDARPFMCL